MSEELEALFDGRRVGRIRYAGDRLRFDYDDAWREDRASFPLSLSMPLTSREHPDAVVRPFISGLLPDSHETLRRWGRRFQVSPREPFAGSPAGSGENVPSACNTSAAPDLSATVIPAAAK